MLHLLPVPAGCGSGNDLQHLPLAELILRNAALIPKSH
jgi:hypothetical protein